MGIRISKTVKDVITVGIAVAGILGMLGMSRADVPSSENKSKVIRSVPLR